MEALQLARRRCAQVNRVRMFGTAPTAITPRTFIKVIISEGAVKGERIRRAARFAMRGSGSIGLQQDVVFTGYGTICITRLLPAGIPIPVLAAACHTTENRATHRVRKSRMKQA